MLPLMDMLSYPRVMCGRHEGVFITTHSVTFRAFQLATQNKSENDELYGRSNPLGAENICKKTYLEDTATCFKLHVVDSV